MTKSNPRNIVASVRARLTEFARKHSEELQAILTRYAIEPRTSASYRFNFGFQNKSVTEPQCTMPRPCRMAFGWHRWSNSSAVAESKLISTFGIRD